MIMTLIIVKLRENRKVASSVYDGSRRQ